MQQQSSPEVTSIHANPVVGWIGQRTAFLALVLLVTGLTARVFTELGAPGIVKFFHFGLAMVFSCAILPFVRDRSLQRLLFGLVLLLWVILLSALFNGAGIPNVFLDFLLLAEPILIFVLMVAGPMSATDIRRFQFVILVLLVVHSILAYYQYITEGYMDADLVKGLFFEQGAGHHVAGAIALTSAIYFSKFRFPSFFIKLFFVTLFASVAIITDSKQVVGVFLISLGMLVALKFLNLKQFLQYAALTVSGLTLFLIIGLTVAPGLLFIVEVDRVQQGLEIKLGVFPLIVSYYDSSLNWLVGLGPGHTAGRLAKILPEYIDELASIGATISPVTQAVWDLQESSWISEVYSGDKGGSSMWSPFLSWAGIWGDLGILGLGVYLSLWNFIFLRFCIDDMSRFFIFNILVLGAIYGWLEEPGYMLMVMALIGLNWQDFQLRTKTESEECNDNPGKVHRLAHV